MSATGNGRSPMTNGEWMIECDDIHKAFDGHPVLSGVDCQIPAGKVPPSTGPPLYSVFIGLVWSG